MKRRIANANTVDLKNGFLVEERLIDKAKIYSCLFCNTQYEEGDIYPFKKLLVTAEKAVKLHIHEEHGYVFNNLLSEDKAQTGLTDTQRDFLKNYYAGLTDKEIAENMNISASTVRFQRYNFREKAKQSKFILALYELLEEKEKNAEKVIKSVDENTKMLETLFESLSPLVLKTYSFKKKREEKRILILKTIAKQFEKDIKYTEKEVNAIIKPIYADYATIRRELIENGYMERKSDCSEYWLK